MDHGGRHRIRNGNGNGTDEGSEDDDDDSGMEWEEVPAEAVAASTSQRERAQQELAEAARAQEQEKTAIISAAPSSSSTAKKRKGGPSTSTQGNEAAPSQATTSDAIEVTLGPALANKFAAGTGKTGRKKNSGPSALSIEATLHRAHLQELHKLHAATLLVAGHVRNGWLNDATLRARLLSKVPLVVQNPFFNYGKATHPKASDRSRLFESALRGLLNWWNDRFYVEDARPRSIDLAIASVLDDLDQKYGRVSAAASRQQQQQQQQRAGGGGLPTASSKRETGDDKVLLELLRNPCSLRTEDYADMHDLLAALTQKDRTRLMMPFAEEEHLRELAAAFAPPPPAASPFKTSSASAKSKSSSSASASAAPTPALPTPKAMSAELGELIRNPQSLAKRAVKMAGSHDMSVQLFTATCRALDVPARLVCALPALDYRSRNKIRADDKIGVADEAASASGAVGQLRNSLKPGRKGKGKSRAKGTGPGKRKRGANGTGTGTGTATSTGGNTSASVSYAEEEEEEEANSDEDAEFEEVAIPSSLPSAARKKANVNAIGAAASKAATSNSNGKGKRPSVAAAIFAGTGTPKSGHGSDASATGSAKSAAGTQQRTTAKSAASPTQASGVRSAPGGLIASRKGKNRAPVEDEDDIVAGVPTFWTEVYNRPNQEWMTVDVIRGRIRPRKGEMDNGRLFYAIAYEVDQYVKDVTPRYAKSFAGRTLKMRIAKKRKDEADWWEATLAPFSRPFVLGREMKEDEELERMQEAEPMPTVLEGFKNHPRFLLERHLKREEALLPKTRQLGLFRGEPVFPRSAVVDVKSAESWMREGRVVSEGQQPLKNVKQRAVTIQKRRMQEMAEQDGHEGIMQGLYSRKQTELVVPPPVVDGKVPKNSYGNLDLFAPHMLPAGGVHLPFKSIRKVAKDLGVDFAEAVTGFEFHKRRAIPVIDGIVVAVEVREMLLEAFYASETLAVEKEAQKRKERCLKRWKKLIVGLRVRSRIQGEYHKGGTKQSNAGQPAQGGSGAGEQNGAEQEGVSQFQALPEDDAQLAGAPEVRDQPPDPSAGPGGFINGTLQQEIPGGAAFPSMPVPLAGNDVSADPGTGEMPAVDFTSLKLPPMPAPAPAPAKAGGNGMDLDEFTLADPEELAEGGIDPDDESEPDQALAGGFVRVEDEEAASQIGQVNAKDFARQTMPSSRSEPEGSDASHGGSMENDVEVDAPRLRRQRAQASQKEEKAKIRVGNGSSSGRPARRALDDDEDAEEGALSVGGDSPASDPASADDDEEDDEEGEADFEVPAASSRPARATRTPARTTKGGPAGTIETSSTPNTRRSGRSTKSAATPVTASGPAASTRSTRASHRKKVTNPEEESEVKPQRSSGRPTRAVAQRSGKKAIVDISSGTEGEGSDN